MNKNKFKKVLLNRIKLDSCKVHRFGEKDGKGSILCVECGGMMSLPDVNQYMRGYFAAGGNPNDLWPNFMRDGEIDVRCPKCLSFEPDLDCALCGGKSFVTAEQSLKFIKQNNL